jgi:hypothetical protein
METPGTILPGVLRWEEANSSNLSALFSQQASGCGDAFRRRQTASLERMISLLFTEPDAT